MTDCTCNPDCACFQQEDLDAHLTRDQRIYREGWYAAAKWANRTDLNFDVDSPAFERERDAAIAKVDDTLTHVMDETKTDLVNWGRYPYTYACDYLRKYLVTDEPGMQLSRAEASHLMALIATALGHPNHEIIARYLAMAAERDGVVL